MKPPKLTNQEIATALIDRVLEATPKRGNERDVRTVISRPMWKRWCRAVGLPVNSVPTAWIGIENTKRVFGSETIIVESKAEFAFSTAINPADI